MARAKQRSPAAPAPSNKLTQADARAWLRAMPFPGYPALVLHALVVLASNGYVLWLLYSGRLPPAGLILLVAIEFVALMLLVRLLAIAVPREHWFEQPEPWSKTLPMLAFLVVWCGGAYGITLLMIDGWPALKAYFEGPHQWQRTGLTTALAISLGLALVAGAGDWLRYKRLGPPYIPSTSADCAARLMTLIFGAIPFAMPFFMVAIAGFKGVEWLLKRAKVAPHESVAGALAMLAVGYGSFLLVGLLIGAGVAGWALGYVLAKLIAELFIVIGLPLVMQHEATAPSATTAATGKA